MHLSPRQAKAIDKGNNKARKGCRKRWQCRKKKAVYGWMDGCEHGKNHHHVVGMAILSTNQHGVGQLDLWAGIRRYTMWIHFVARGFTPCQVEHHVRTKFAIPVLLAIDNFLKLWYFFYIYVTIDNIFSIYLFENFSHLHFS